MDDNYDKRLGDVEDRLTVVEHNQRTETKRLEIEISNLKKAFETEIRHSNETMSAKLDAVFDKLLADVRLSLKEQDANRNTYILKWIFGILASVIVLIIGSLISYII